MFKHALTVLLHIMLLSKILRPKTWIAICNDISNALLPQLCFGCMKPLLKGEYILCTTCRHELPLTHHNFHEDNAVDRIFYGRVPLQKAAAFLFFTKHNIVQSLLHALKYKNQEQIGDFLGMWCGAILEKDQGLQDVDMVIPVPLHPKKLKKRGYNQVALFAKSIAISLHAEYREDVLLRTINTKTQTKKNRHMRWENTKVAFQHNAKVLMDGKHILLVDDVITTGATLESCTRALLKNHTPKVSVLGIALVI